MKSFIYICILSSILVTKSMSTDFHVGPGQSYAEINDVPWESMSPGDNIYIHYRDEADGGPYHAKWVVNVPGSQALPFKITGISGPGGQRPVIDGNNASTRLQLNYWNEERSVIKVGGSSVPADGMPSYIVIENLEIRSGHNSYNFTDDGGNINTYSFNASAIHVEKVNNLIIRNCIIHDSGNGIFVSSNSNDITIEYNYIYGNGNVGRILEHNTYTEANNILYQFNRFGPLRPGADGNNLKDRSAGLVVRNNWIEGGNRLLDLVDSGSTSIINDPSYKETFVYGNILIEEDGGNNQVIHYGGDSGITSQYRKGILHFYNNTMYSLRAGNTTLTRLSTNDESADIRNNIMYVTANGSSLALLDDSGQVAIYNNLVKPGWVSSHQGAAFSGSVQDNGSGIEVDDPGFIDAPNYDFSLSAESPAGNAGTNLHPDVAGSYNLEMEYVKHQAGQPRPVNGDIDIGGFEQETALPVELYSPFKVINSGDHVTLSWQTANEYNVDYFTISRNNDSNWLTVQPSNTNHVASYQLSDQEPPPGRIVYRLYETDINGHKTKLGEDVVELFDINLKVFPNPTSDKLFLNLPHELGKINYTIWDINGHLIINGKYIQDGIDLSHLTRGLYILKLIINEKPLSFPVIKQ